MLHLILPRLTSRRSTRLLRFALPTAILTLVLGSAAESVRAQLPPNYVCYLRQPNGEVVNLSSICGSGEETERDQAAGGSFSIRDVQVTDAGLTGVIVNESDQPIRIDGLGYQLTQAGGQAVLAGNAVPVTNVLLPNEPVQFLVEFSGDDRTQLEEYADVDLELAIAPGSITPVEQDNNAVSGEVENSPTTNDNVDNNLDGNDLDADTGTDDGITNDSSSGERDDGTNDVEPGNNLETDELGGLNDADDADASDPTDSTFDSDGNTDTDDTFDSTGGINDGDSDANDADASDPTDSTFDSDGNTDTDDTFDSTGGINDGDSDANDADASDPTDNTVDSTDN